MPTNTAERNGLWASLLVEELARCGVRRCCISPGSRSSPLALALARHPRIESIVHFDERAAAFYAVGLARATGETAACLTTSGTAAANAAPALAEAANACLPLLLITADRPPELRDTGANQTIDQVRMFGNHVRWQLDMPCPDKDVPLEYVLTSVDQAVYRTRSAPAGPVHLNCMFREPLIPAAGAAAPALPASLASWRDSQRPYTLYSKSGPAADTAAIAALAASLGRCRRGLLVVGQLTTAEREPVRKLALALGWPMVADVTSGLRLGAQSLPLAVYADQMLLSETLAAALKPDAILHVGGPVTSKRVAQFLARHRPPLYARLHEHPFRHDPQHGVTWTVQASLDGLCASLAASCTPGADKAWTQAWLAAQPGLGTRIDSFLDGQTGVGEIAVAREISRRLPAAHGLFLASSMPVRDMDMYAVETGAAHAVSANRGASGIDGTLATAAGFARGLGRPVTVVLGDLACLHDLNALDGIRRSPHPVTVVVINNNGGGIFSFLPMAAHKDVFERFFGTPHGLHFEGAAAMFGLAYARPTTHTEFAAAYCRAVEGSASSLIEVVTDREENHRLHTELQKLIREQLEA
jgi:2-succinyl-5-enolpyruvyl-6-hydroxy-3-cyclohexene-1-carboxylate synthase